MYEFTPADPTRKRPGHEERFTDKQKILFLYIPVVAFASVMSGIVMGKDESAGFVQIIFGITVNVLALWWAKIDADERAYTLSQFFPIAVVFFGVFAIIYYLFRSRGLNGGLTATGWLILYIVTTAIVLMIVSMIVTAVLVTVGLLPKELIMEN